MRESQAALRQALRDSVSTKIPVAAVETEDEAPAAKRQRVTSPAGRGKPPRPCSHCNGDHWNNECPTRPPRNVKFSRHRQESGDITCFRCYGKGHRAFDCKEERPPASPRASATPPAGATPSPLRIVVNAQTGAETTFDQASWEAFQNYKKYQSAMHPSPPYYQPPVYQGHQPAPHGSMNPSPGQNGGPAGTSMPAWTPPPHPGYQAPAMNHGGPPGHN